MEKKKKIKEIEIKNQDNKELDVNGFKKILEYFVKHMVYVCNVRNEKSEINGSDSAKQDKKKTIVTVKLENFNQEPFTSYTPKEGSKSGQGYNGGSIQETMESEAKVEDSIVEILEKQQKICISVDGTGGFRGGSYLHLVSTDMINKKKDDSQNKVTNETAGTNIIPVFETINVESIDEKTIETVRFVGLEVGPSLNNPTYVFPKLKHTFDDLGLFKDEPTEEQKYNLKTFFEYFLKMREQELMGGLTYKGREQLLTTHNMILTGAPGTGKTWSAKNIAAWIINGKSYLELDRDEKSEFKKRCELVQFHPSYDYTDFVEGLRPINNSGLSSSKTNEIGFDLIPGVFKKFCEKALGDWNHCYDTINDLTKDDSIKNKCIKEDEIDKLVDAIQKEGEGFKLGQTNDEFFKTKFSEEECSKNAQKFVKEATKKFAPKYIFIIDEINRGELSKIFGELFFSIDPGYRGPDGAVLTQYANMVKTQNVFDKKIDPSDTNKEYGHFFVPENVYIIGTMNDIDRSVESMDFAMRRRFSFIEVKSNERMDMWTEDWKDIAAACMEAVNAEIEKIPGLSSAYHIGPAYFKKLNDYDGNFFKLWDNHLYGVIFEYLRGKKDAKTTIDMIQDKYLEALVNAIIARFNQGGKWGAKLLKNWKNASVIDSSITIDGSDNEKSKDNIKGYLDNLQKNISYTTGNESNRADEIFKLSNAIKYLMDIGDKIEKLS